MRQIENSFSKFKSIRLVHQRFGVGAENIRSYVFRLVKLKDFWMVQGIVVGFHFFTTTTF